MAKVLVYRFSESEENTIRHIAGEMEMTVRRVLPEEENEIVIKLLAKPEIMKTFPGTMNPSEKMLLVAENDRKRVFELFNRLSEAGIQVSCKAVVTPTNLNWSFRELYDTIREESKRTLERVRLQENAKKS